MTLKGISKREFARRDGCDEKLVRRGVTLGKLMEFSDGSIDPALVGTPWRERPERADKGADNTPPVRTDDGLVSYAEAQTRKENYLAKLRQLEYEIKAGQYVEAAAVAKWVSENFVKYKRAMQGIPARHTSEMAAVLGCDPHRLDVELSRVIRDTLQSLAEPLLKR